MQVRIESLSISQNVIAHLRICVQAVYAYVANPAELTTSTGPEVIKLFSCSTQLSMKFFLFINVKMPTIVGILTFMNRKNSIISLSEPKKC